jgi:hypothetical protein
LGVVHICICFNGVRYFPANSSYKTALDDINTRKSKVFEHVCVDRPKGYQNQPAAYELRREEIEVPCFNSHKKMNKKNDLCVLAISARYKKGRLFLSCSFWLEGWFLERRRREQ